MRSPRTYLVVSVDPKDGKLYRAGVANDLTRARKIIDDAKKPPETFGGLIGWPNGQDHTYQIWKAKWEFVE